MLQYYRIRLPNNFFKRFFSTFFTGTHDVDCPTNDSQNPFGLCCFDGCQNSCLKTCKTVLENVTAVSTPITYIF